MASFQYRPKPKAADSFRTTFAVSPELIDSIVNVAKPARDLGGAMRQAGKLARSGGAENASADHDLARHVNDFLFPR